MLLPNGAPSYAAPSFHLETLIVLALCFGFGVWLACSVRHSRRHGGADRSSQAGRPVGRIPAASSAPLRTRLANEALSGIDRDGEADSRKVVTAVGVVE